MPDEGDGEEQLEGSDGPRECMACRGSGKVTSNLGGRPSSVTCPWCEGSGVRRAGADAQARWLQGQDSGSESGEPPDSAA